MSDNKPVLDYQDTRPTAAQKRKRWFLVAGLVGGSLAAAGVRYWLAPAKAVPVAAPNPPVMLDGVIVLPPTTGPSIPPPSAPPAGWGLLLDAPLPGDAPPPTVPPEASNER